jgi:hypothetical protein
MPVAFCTRHGYPGAVSWDLPSPRVRELIRQGAEIALHLPEDWLVDLVAACAGDQRPLTVLASAATR